MGALFNQDIPEAPPYFNASETLTPNQVKLRWINPQQTVHGNPVATITTTKLFRNDSLIAEISLTSMRDTLEFIDNIPKQDYYRYQICAVDTLGQQGRILYGNEQWFGPPIEGIVIWELDPTPITGAALKTSLQAAGYSGNIYQSPSSIRYELTGGVEAVFVCLGIYDNNHVLSPEEGTRLKNYLENGGNLYMEGGDTWYYDPQTPVHPYFEINATSDGSSDLFFVNGEAGTPYQNMQFAYNGENNWMDHIEPTALSQRILYNMSTQTGVAVAYDAGSYKTIGASFELGGLVDDIPPSTKTELVKNILTFFGILSTDIQANNRNETIPESFIIQPNYPNPFNNSTVIKFGIPQTGDVQFAIFALTGQKIYSAELSQLQAGWHTFRWAGTNQNHAPVASGIYFYRLIYQNESGGKFIKSGKMHLLK